jgi:hypothetical protein
MAEQVKVDIKTIEAKLDKNEKLTVDEEKFLMEQQPGPEGFQPPIPGPEEKEEPKEQTSEESKATQDKADADKKAKDALIARAKTAGLPETATEAEIQAAEKKEPAESNQVDMLKLEEMLAKPEGKEDFTGWTKREQAYYWRMRREQKRASQAEADRDAARFELIKAKKEKPSEEPKAEEEDPLKGKEEGDFLTVAEARKILAKIQKKEEPKGGGSFMELPFVQSFIKICDEKAATEKPDYEEVMELTEEIINTNPAYQKQVAESLIKGENPALKMYELIQADPEYAKLLPAAQTRVQARKAKKSDKKEEPKAKTAEELKKEADAAEAEKKLKENADKPKTSGHAEGKDKIEGSDYTLEQITAMSDREFSKLPKKVREKYLELYG